MFTCLSWLARRSERIFCNDGRVRDKWVGSTKSILSRHAELVLVPLMELGHRAASTNDEVGHRHPCAAVNLTPLDNVVGDLTASVVFWRVPGQRARILCHVVGLQWSLRW